MDGNTGFEFWYMVGGVQRQAELVPGDELIYSNGRTSFKRQVQA
jgi:hypothetical protein